MPTARAFDGFVEHTKRESPAPVIFQVPIYAAIIAFSGASGDGLIRGILGAAVMMLVLGNPYGAFLNLIKRLFGLPPGGESQCHSINDGITFEREARHLRPESLETSRV